MPSTMTQELMMDGPPLKRPAAGESSRLGCVTFLPYLAMLVRTGFACGFPYELSLLFHLLQIKL